MVKLTAELIEQSQQYTNALRDRELDLRGYKIPVIENMGATLDQFDTIDFSDNDIRKLDGFPLLRRLKTLLANNNRIVRIGEGLEESIPNLESLILSNNSLQELGDLDPLSTLKSLTYLSLLRNPVTTKKHYRLYVINKVPSLRVLDFQRVRLKEREAAAKMFKGKKGQALAADIGKKSKTFVPGEGLPEAKKGGPSKEDVAAIKVIELRADPPFISYADIGKKSKTFVPGEALPEAKKGGPSKEDVAAIKLAIANAKTLEEVERLNNMLKTGQIPGKQALSKAGRGEEEMETNGT